MISSRTISFLDDQTLEPGKVREALFRDERCGFLLYRSEGLSPSEANERIVRLEMREALLWLNQPSEDAKLFCD